MFIKFSKSLYCLSGEIETFSLSIFCIFFYIIIIIVIRIVYNLDTSVTINFASSHLQPQDILDRFEFPMRLDFSKYSEELWYYCSINEVGAYRKFKFDF